jgi:tetrahydromethanopterin S-methyltransferase subunit H
VRGANRIGMQQMMKPEDLAAACDVLGEIMMALAARRLLAVGISNKIIHAKMMAQVDDAALENLAERGFEAAAMALAKAGYPGATVHQCNLEEEPGRG